MKRPTCECNVCGERVEFMFAAWCGYCRTYAHHRCCDAQRLYIFDVAKPNLVFLCLDCTRPDE
jgi:hypothetical protein